MSFVRSESDIRFLKEFMKLHHIERRIVAKIEDRLGLENLPAIVQEVDMVMVARGDMGISLPMYEVPF